MEVNWLGDFVVPITTLVLSTGLTVALARGARRDQQSLSYFEHDMRYADEFAHATENIHAWTLVGLDESDFRQVTGRLNKEWHRVATNMTGTDRTGFGAYLSQHERDLGRAWSQLRETVLAHPNPDSMPLALLARSIPQAPRLISQMELHIAAMKDMVRDWPFPERRRECLGRILEWQAASQALPATDTRLAIDRWMLVSAPSAFGPVRAWRRWSVATRQLLDDARYRRLGLRWRVWLQTIAVNRQESKAVREAIRTARLRRRVMVKKRIEWERRFREGSIQIDLNPPPSVQPKVTRRGRVRRRY